jgi:hypothetical protein
MLVQACCRRPLGAAVMLGRMLHYTTASSATVTNSSRLLTTR